MCEKKSMNIYKKLQEARCQLQDLNLKKTGQNKFAGYSYFELGDILPAINNINKNLGLCTHITFDNEFAKLIIIDSDSFITEMEFIESEEVHKVLGKTLNSIEFTSPMASASLKGAHDIQNLGATETYQRRYLYMSAYEIVEHDSVDSSKGKAPKELIDTNKIPDLIKEIEEKSTVEEVKQLWNEFESKYVTNKRVKDAVIARGKELSSDSSVQ